MPPVSSAFKPTTVTLYDAITDSPVYRANIHHYDDQLERLETWLESLLQHFKTYTQLMTKLSAEANLICSQAVPLEIDELLLDSNFTNGAMGQFARTLQNQVSLQHKLASDLEEQFIHPLQQFIQTHLQEYKQFRKQHEKALHQYESQLQKYASVSKSKDRSNLYEEQLQLYDARETYVRMSSQHVLRLFKFRSVFQQHLIEAFSAAADSYKDNYYHAEMWQNLSCTLAAWKQWLTEDGLTCNFHIWKEEQTCQRLQEEYLQKKRPRMTIASRRRHSAALFRTNFFGESPPKSHSGYLFLRVSNNLWMRKWCFLHNGYFGMLSTVSDTQCKNTIVIDMRLPLSHCSIQSPNNSQRRLCFEIQTGPRSSICLQAETEEELQEWLACFLGNQQQRSKSDDTLFRDNSFSSQKSVSHATSDQNDPPCPRSPRLVSSKSKSTTVVSTPTDIPVTLSTSFRSNLSGLSILSTMSGPSSPETMSLNQAHSDTASVRTIKTRKPSSRHPTSLANAPSMTPALLEAAVQVNLDDATFGISKTGSLSSRQDKGISVPWVLPWAIIPNRGHSRRSDSLTLRLRSSSESKTSPSERQPIWPTNPPTVSLPPINIEGYASDLESKNREARYYFPEMVPKELVLDVLVACVRRKPTNRTMKAITEHVSADKLDHAVLTQQDIALIRDALPAGYAYSGQLFLTADALYFYSCVVMHSVHSVVVRFTDIADVRLAEEKEASCNTVESVVAIDLVEGYSGSLASPLLLSCRTQGPEMVVEKLRFLLNNAKSSEPMQLRNVYQKILALSKPKQSSMVIAISSRSIAQQSDEAYLSSSTTTTVEEADQTPEISDDLSAGEATIESSGANATDELPPNFELPEGPVECGCEDHLDRLEAEIDFPISAKRLFELMFSDEQNAAPTDGGVWQGKTAAIAGHDLKVTHWENTENGTQRFLSYWMPVSNPIVRMKEAEVVETQNLLKKEDHIRYVVQISTKTAALPYAEAFIPSVKYCITYVSKDQCKLSLHLGVRWVQRVMVRAIVTRAALKGMADSVNVFIPILKDTAQNIAAEASQAQSHALKKAGVSIENVQTLETKKTSVQPDTPTTHDATIKHSDRAEKEHPSNVHLSPQMTAVPSNSVNKMATQPSASNKREIPSAACSSKQNPVAPSSNASAAQYHNKTASSLSLKHSHSLFPETVKVLAGRGVIVLAAITVLLIYGMAMTSLTLQWWNYPGRARCETASMQQFERKTHTNDTIVRHVVYLRDLDEGILNTKFQPSYARTPCYQQFVQAHQPVPSRELPFNVWFDKQYYKEAIKLDTSRQNMAMMRSDLLSLFQILNNEEAQIIEQQYINWLSDQQLHCSTLDTWEQTSHVPACTDILEQIRLFNTS
ncbi:uncharacterized protein BYT42DRAFT_643857 [Radiomyces spectabilis]|uniref:uncharacterized protein n=1 Tax=Radiomyces spectabilis TaxID=64574 RepID=UPI00221F0A36|nr:uncharacterized protein BYT42DRAFT_643857 [Radiomyces spectabilis]KAI8380980.1 hypothetical protein BYT42DRAFT_643857 [Radiomyces spectabilis]